MIPAVQYKTQVEKGLLTAQLNQAYLFREGSTNGSDQDVSADVEQDEKEKDQPVIYCRACGWTITSEEKRMIYAGSHTHTYFNPAGILFEIGCFSAAEGCAVVGEASAEFSWFAGCVWRLAVCAGCASHLGWQFQGGGDVFFGLIVNRLKW